MFGKKKDNLPKDFDVLLEKQSVEQLKTFFDKHDVNARGGYSNQTAIAFSECSDDLTRWLVEQGADLNAVDKYGDTPLHARARHWKGRVEVLVELGADVNHSGGRHGTPLHAAASSFKPDAARLLIAHGARVDALNSMRETPLEAALRVCRNAEIEHAATLADMLLAAGARQAPKMKDDVARIGIEFEFHRSNFNPDKRQAADAGLRRLYELFDVAPVPPRLTHDGASPIAAPPGEWHEQHQALWELLVPSRGAAATVQGEVIRITGKISHELCDNGGVNWDNQYRDMAKAFLDHIASGTPLPQADRDEAARLVPRLKQDGDGYRLSELAVAWVARNPAPIGLPKPSYER